MCCGAELSSLIAHVPENAEADLNKIPELQGLRLRPMELLLGLMILYNGFAVSPAIEPRHRLR